MECDRSIADRLTRVVELVPHSPAIKTESYSWTYLEFDQHASRFAAVILEKLGPGLEPVALLFRHDAPLIAAIFGVLKAGKMFTSLDPAFPEEYMISILRILNARLLVVDAENYLRFKNVAPPGYELLVWEPGEGSLDRRISTVHHTSDVPFVVAFTSGSTGKPKGVAMSHRAYLHRVWSGRVLTPIFPVDRHSHLTPCSFMGSMGDLLRALLNGCTLYLMDVREKGFAYMATWINQESITLFHPPISLFRHFLSHLDEKAFFPGVRTISLTGDTLYKKDLENAKKHFSTQCVFEHRYASSEIIVGASMIISPRQIIDTDIIPAGFPFGDKELWVVDEEKNRLETGEIGRIAVRSRYLADGYWHQPEETEKHFINDPLDEKKRIFFSDDLGRILPNGMLEFHGRADDMVKIRGFRVEKVAIEAALLGTGVRQAVVVEQTDTDGDKHIVAYVVPEKDNHKDPPQIRSELAHKLPDYMLPGFYVYMDGLPFLPNGKIDRLALPNPFFSENKKRDEIQTNLHQLKPIEEKVFDIVVSILKLDAIGFTDNIFVHGCNSLLAARIIALINEHFRVEIPIREIYNYPTASDLAGIIQARQNQGSLERIKSVLDPSTLDYLSQFA